MISAIEIQVLTVDEDDIERALADNGVKYSKSTVERFDGGGICSFIVELTPPVLSFLAGLYVARLNANKHISYKKDGFEVKGVSEKTLLKLISSEGSSFPDEKA